MKMKIRIPASELLEIALGENEHARKYEFDNEINLDDINSMCDFVLMWCSQHNPQIEYYSQICTPVCVNMVRYISGEDPPSYEELYVNIENVLEDVGLSSIDVIEKFGLENVNGRFSRRGLLARMAEDKFVFVIEVEAH